MNDILSRIKHLSPEKRKLLEQKMAAAGLDLTGDSPPQPTEKRDYYTASPAQQRMYLIQQLDGVATGYNMPWCRRLDGELDVQRLKRALNRLAVRHETLRTRFRLKDGLIVAMVVYEVEISLEVVAAENEDEALELGRRFITHFNLHQAPLARAQLIRVSPKLHIFTLDMHHIVADGFSLGILIRDLGRFYNDDDDAHLQPLQYKDYALWQLERAERGLLSRQLATWSETLGGRLPVLDLPLDFPRPAVQSFSGDRVMFRLPDTVRNGLIALGRAADATLFMILSLVTAVLLSKYSGQQDIIIGSPVAGRRHPDLGEIVGMFVNTLALRFFPKRELTVEELLGQVKETALRAFDNQDVPFEEVVDALDVRRDLSRNPVFDVMLALQNMDVERCGMKGIEISNVGFSRQSAKFDLLFNVVQEREGFFLVLEYCTALWSDLTIRRMTGHFKHLAAQIAASPRKRIGELCLATAEEKERILRQFNHPGDREPAIQTVTRLFFRSCRWHPLKVALVEGEYHLSYEVLAGWVAMLARQLRERGVGAESVVALMVERSMALIAGILSILEAGGCVLAIDPSFPEERIGFMLRDSGARIVLRGDDIAAWDGGSAASDSGATGHGEDLLYVIYTSGSTGRPKGVMLEHRHLVNLLLWQFRGAGIDFGRVVQFTTISFDVAFQEIFSTLLWGGALIMVSKEIVREAPRLLRLMAKQAVETAFFPASFLKYVFNHEELSAEMPSSFGHIITAGEQVVVNRSMRLFLSQHRVRLHNHYGPSETHVVTAASFDPDREIPSIPPIGAPVDNTMVYVLDPEGQLQPAGVPGELCIGGAQVGRGYLDRVELTADKFCADPFFGGEMYRTGDLAKWFPDGALMFLGRMDGQVKIRGFRIEPGEIEEALLDMADVWDAVVMARQDAQGEAYLCAYAATELAVGELKRRLMRSLPEYMIPSSIVIMDALPLTPNRKVDRRALPDPLAKGEAAEDIHPPENSIQRSLAFIWSAILRIDPASIGIDRSFFDLGGHSLRAAALVARIERELKVELPLTEVFKHPTIRGMGELIQRLESGPKEGVDRGIPTVEKKDYYPLSPAQRRLFVASQLDEQGTGYNMPQRILLEGPLDIPRFKAALGALVRRHEALRTTFHVVGGRVVQRVWDVVDIVGNVDFVDGVDLADFVAPFSLDSLPLWRVVVIGGALAETVVLWDMHHIISDGVSQEIIRRELEILLRGEGLTPLSSRYVDVVVWQEARLKAGDMTRLKEYWLDRYPEGAPALELPFDFRAPRSGDLRGSNVCFYLTPLERSAVGRLAAGCDVSEFMVWMGLVGLVLWRFCRQGDFVVGFPASGRGRKEIEGLVGMFIDPLPLRFSVEAGMRLKEYLAFIRESVLGAMEHREGVSDELLEGISVMVNLVDRRRVIDDRRLEAAVAGTHRPSPSKFHLSLIVYEGEDSVRCNVEYRRSLFRPDTIDRFIGWCRNALARFDEMDNPLLHELEVMGPEERRRLLEEFNDTYRPLTRERILHRLILRQANEHPAGIAVSCGDWCLGYRELILRASALALQLQRQGVGPDKIVALSMERGGEMIIGILGILMAGGAYLWIDPHGPPRRQQFLGRQSGAVSMVTLMGTRGMNPCLDEFFAEDTVYLDSKPSEGGTDGALPEVEDRNLAYVIYTSGTSGRPKGVMVEHGAAVNFICAMERLFGGVDKKDRCLSLTNLSFDVSVWEIFLPLCYGARLVVLGYGRLLDPIQLTDALAVEAVTMAYLPPGLLKEVAAMLGRQGGVVALDKLLVGVEPIEDAVLESFLRLNNKMRIVNGYGPTETCVCATAYVFDGGAGGGVVPIGKPLDNNRVVLLDQRLNLVPQGAVGELCVAGANLARGYLDCPELTVEAFVPCQLLEGERIYRTGDLARWRPEGNLRFLGRIDRQVKIRGFRVEPGEVAGRLLEHSEVREAAVVDWLDKAEQRYLAAYVAIEEGDGGTGSLSQRLTEFLRGFLPEYMIPSTFTLLPAIPLTTHGKLDRLRLPEPKIEADVDSTPPATPLEVEMVRLWAEVLMVDEGSISMESDFFRLGGHSLKATVLTGRILNRWKARLPLSQLFNAPTPAAVCAFLERAVEGLEAGPTRCEKRDYYPLTPAQAGVYVKLRYEGGSLAYNIPHWIPLEGQVEALRLERALEALIRRHRSFRTAFIEVSGQPVQRVVEDVWFRLELREAEEASPAAVMESFVRQFDITCPPLLRALLLRREGEDDLLLLDVHHLVSDGVSQEIFRRELEALLRGEVLRPLEVDYTDVSLWRQQVGQDLIWQRHRRFWLDSFASGAPLIQLPLDFERPAVKSFDGALVPFVADEALSKALHQLAADRGSTLYMVLLAAYFVLLHRYSNQDDLVVGSPVMGRRHPVMEPVVGLFVNMLALRARPRPGLTFRGFLTEVKELVTQSMEHQIFGYEELVAELGLQGNMARNPLFDVVLAMQAPRERASKPKRNAPSSAGTMAKFDLLLNVFPAPDGIRMALEYCARLFRESTVRDMADHYLQILEQVTEEPGLLIESIDIASGLAMMDGEGSLDDGDFGF